VVKKTVASSAGATFTTASTDAMEDPVKPRRHEEGLLRWSIETALLVVAAFAIAMAVQATVAEAFEVPTPSMAPTIQEHDRIIAEKISHHFRAPQPGDVVVFGNPLGGKIPFVKRVIATEGQTVDVHDGAVWVDGNRLDEPFTHGLPDLPGTVTLPVRVPPNHIWVMGDNRTNSKDSRYFGAIPVDSIIARGIAVYWPLSEVKWF
jgi:signal peptidase I